MAQALISSRTTTAAHVCGDMMISLISRRFPMGWERGSDPSAAQVEAVEGVEHRD
jgi:hypothetical protein